MRRLHFACVLMFAATAAFAASIVTEDEYTIASSDQTDFGVDLRAEREHQEFEDSSADIDTLSVQPWLQIDNWSFSLDVPWQRAEGEYFLVGGAQPAPKNICQVPSSFLQKYPRLAATAGATCPTNAPATSEVREESGIGDITGFVHYGKPLDDRGVWLGSVGLGYKADSGDVEEGMGSGTRDVMAEGILGAGIGKFNATAVAGYTWIVGGDAEEGTNDYAYATLDLAAKPLRWLTLGVSWDYQEAYVSVGDDVQWLTAYVGLNPLDYLRVRLYTKDYRDTLGYPETEYGGYVGLSF